ncbi:MAG: SWIM zinc finger family protein [Dehalococcoidia bacterium]|nr:SWIM zinc finger family protein [Dehalococcoidia bacterium]MDZ4247136.1 SWIM zinc finger family protein [Dehalococcoidia bacterium]
MKHPKADIFKQLTWDDIEAWAGINITSRGQSYQRSLRVQELACTSNGGVVAWVKGSRKYVTMVDIDGKEELTSACTCPYEDVCKHAVAVVLEYLEKLKQNIQVPTVAEGDTRLTLLDNTQEGARYEESEDLEHTDVQPMASQSRKASPDTLHSYLERQSKEEFIALIEDMAERYPEVHEALHDRCHLSQGEVSALVKKVRKEIGRLSAEPAWVNPWKGEGNVPDYSEVRDRLVMLLSI